MIDPTSSRYRYAKSPGAGMHRRFIRQQNGIEQKELEMKNEHHVTHGTYGALLFRPEWKLKRQLIIQRDGNCRICRNKHDLQVHHRQYHFLVLEQRFKDPWDYDGQLLITLCESCHKRGHSKFKVPTINI